jgi:hypothetical protein
MEFVMKIVYKKENPQIFWEKWKEYITNNISSFRYLPLYIDYMLYYSSDLYEDMSFVVIENNKCVGICFLPIENKTFKTISLAGSYTIAPLSINERIEKAVFFEIEKIANRYDIKLIKFFLDPLIGYKFNILLKYGFFNTSSTNCIVDLRKPSNKLWQNLRKSYKPLINGILKNSDYTIFIMNSNNADYEIHECYRKLHHKCAGRVTRNKKTFDKQFEMLKNGYATLMGLKYKNKFIGMQYFFHYQKTVVYASGADDPEYTAKKFNIYHPILWKAQLYFKENGFDFLEYSQPCAYCKIQGFDDYYDKKQLNIGHFKRGMGADMTMLFRGIKFYDNNLFINYIKKLEKQIKAINE